MPSKYARARLTAAVVVAFLCGLVFASGFNLTRFGFAQSKVPSKPSSAEVRPLMETQNGFEAIADHVRPAVVSIKAEHLPKQTARSRTPRSGQPGGIEDFFHQFEMPQDGASEASGSGFIVSKDGYILTNNHVVADADRVTVMLLDNRTFAAKVVGRDPTTDVAVIKVDASDLPTVSLGDDSKARIGQWVVAIGNPLGLNFTMTAGIVSSKGRELQGLPNTSRYQIQDFIQTDAAINPGNSGGPLVNINGEVIGINSAIASATGFYAGYGFAIPITLAKQVMDDIISYGHVRRAVLGISILEVDPNDAKVAGLSQIRGVKVAGFDPPDDPDASPGRKAGLEVGDIIISAGGKEIATRSELQRIIRGYVPGDVVPVDVMRFGQRKTFSVKLGAPPADRTDVASAAHGGAPVSKEGASNQTKLGMSVSPVPSDMIEEAQLKSPYKDGVLITDVDPSGPAYNKLGNQGPPRTIIFRELYPNKRDIRSVSDLENALSGLHKGDMIELETYTILGPQTGQTTPVTLQIGG